MLLMYCLASLPFVYAFSFAPSSELIGFIIFFVINVVACFLDMIFAFITVYSQAQATGATAPTKSTSILTSLAWLLAVLFPCVNFKHALFNIRLKSNPDCVSALNSLLFTSYSADDPWMSVRTPGLGATFLIFFGQIVLWTLVLVLIENGTIVNLCCRKCCKCDQDLQQIGDTNQSIDDIQTIPSRTSEWDNEGGTVIKASKEWDDTVC
jgi:hypothetical protein